MKNYLTRQLQQVKTKSQMFLLSLSLFLTGSTVYADDPFAKSDNLAKQGITKVQLVSVALFGLAAVVTSLIYAFGGRELKASMKKIGCLLQLQLLVFQRDQVLLNGFLIS